MKGPYATVLLFSVAFVGWMSAGLEVDGPRYVQAAQATIGKLETQTNREGLVTVKVTPKDISPEAKSWDFEITLETHTASIDQDMRRVAVLVDGSANPQQPLAWQPDPSGGHHLKGLLRFEPLSGSPEFLSLAG